MWTAASKVSALRTAERCGRGANFYVDRLTVSARSGQGTDFNATFDLLDNGRWLQVTRRVSVEGLRDTVEVRSM
jgi:hypothetical protein